MNILIFFPILGNFIGVFCQKESPILKLPDGKVQGTVKTTVGENKTFYAYRGIPFAKPPIGELRFSDPVKNDPWEGVLNATEDKSWCVQTSSRAGVPGGTIIGTEDCLYVNVYTTNLTGNLPAMVWIYGGGFNGGTSAYSVYGPDYLLDQGVIYVAFNYRLGIFGFLSTEDVHCPGNWGLKDQILALRWVKDNIKYFGGDPDKITIFGESAGAASVSYLVQSPLTAGLYRGAIMESGTSLCLWALTHGARQRAFKIGIKLGILTLSSQDLVSKLRKIDYKKLKTVENNVTIATFLTSNVLAGLPIGVVKEPAHSRAVFTGNSHQILSNGSFQKVPLIIGYNSNEGAGLGLYVALLQPILFQYDVDLVRLAPYDLTTNYFKRLMAGSLIRRHYFGAGFLHSQPNAIVEFANVDQFNRPIRETVRQMSKFTNVFYYKFSYEGMLGDTNNSLPGVGHAEELNYLFVKNSSSAEADRLLRRKFVALWTNFAKTGNPTPELNSGNGNILQGITWVPNSPGSSRNGTVKYLNINHTQTMGSNPDQENWAFYQGIYSTYGNPPYSTY